jgi:hypothetical protein
LPISKRCGAKLSEVLSYGLGSHVMGDTHSNAVMLEIDDLGLPPPGPLAFSPTRRTLVILKDVGLGCEFAVAIPITHKRIDELDVLDEVRPRTHEPPSTSSLFPCEPGEVEGDGGRDGEIGLNVGRVDFTGRLLAKPGLAGGAVLDGTK